jgi:hypothetical protein
VKPDLFDHYNFRARLQPAFLSLVPLAIAAYAWARPDAKWITALWSLLGSAGFTFFLANVARNHGKRIEAELWQSWGGKPTTLLLRHSGPENPVRREQWHKQLSKLYGKTLPTESEERENPVGADNEYDAATRLLIEKTRDVKAYPFVYRDNVNYGFCRNLYALRHVGILTSSLALLACLTAGFWALKAGKVDYSPWGSAVVCGALLLWWVFTITSDWVKVPAINYAQHLFDSAGKVATA